MDQHNIQNLLKRTEPGIILFDNNFQVSHINWALMRIFAETPHEQILEQNLLEMHRGPAGEKLQELVAMALDPSRQASMSVRRMSGSREIFVMLKMIPLLDQKLAKSLHCCLIYDITALISTPQHGFIKVPVSAGGEILLIAPEEIVFIKAENIYSQVLTVDGEFFCDLSLGVLEAGLSRERFFRIHRSYLVNLEKVQKVVRSGNTVSLQMVGSDRLLPVSRQRTREFLTRVRLK
ncbi:MAG: LytTR family transcriptional regulator DNA-binding domain-containing protein [Pedobacter sp.]